MAQQEAIEFEVHSDTASIVTLRGEHDLHSSAWIADALATASATRNVLVDLTHCSFMDSSVLSALFRASRNLHARGGQLALAIPRDKHGAIRSLFEIMSIASLIPTYETRAEALEYFETPQPATSEPETSRLRSLSDIIDQSLPSATEQRRAS